MIMPKEAVSAARNLEHIDSEISKLRMDIWDFKRLLIEQNKILTEMAEILKHESDGGDGNAST